MKLLKALPLNFRRVPPDASEFRCAIILPLCYLPISPLPQLPDRTVRMQVVRM